MSNLKYKTWAHAVGAKSRFEDAVSIGKKQSYKQPSFEYDDDDIICDKLPSRELRLRAVLAPLDPKVTTPERSFFRAMFDMDGDDLDDETISRIVNRRK